MVLSDTPINNASGFDGILSEIWKLVVSKKILESNMSKIIFKTINSIHDSGDIPKNMDISIVFQVPKKGLYEGTR
ncbi:hypothetical protein AYI68_g867 [Smittium mucronatum]|uniref:Uncharacterized protein n=1 Tax=Smittium mucronatum TaxID=133383 RepID=A0A1R0H734_9FUNG|nr:hypothetical protein AYI68_g867 [Smittium mucronatum]